MVLFSRMMLIAIGALLFSSAQQPAFQVKSASGSQNVLASFANKEIVLNRNLDSLKWQDTYAVLIPHDVKAKEQKEMIMQMITPISDLSQDMVVARVHPEMVEAVSALQHNAGMACGGIVELKAEFMQSVPQDAAEPVVALELQEKIEELEAFGTRHHNTDEGESVPATLQSWYQEVADEYNYPIEVSFEDQGRSDQQSLVVRIEGSEFPDELIVVGSHLDSIAGFFGSSNTAPGADDNASGTAVNFAAFTALAQSGLRPSRTIEIHAYAAEEIGLIGSAAIARKYKRENINVVTMMQNDMNLFAQDEPTIHFVTNGTHTPFNKQLQTLVELYAGVPWKEGILLAGTSDHASWTRQGYRSAFPFEHPTNHNKNIHTPNDTVDAVGVSFEQSAAFAKLTAAYLLHFAGGSK
jgi:predicted RNA-binding protein Jag